MADNSLTSKPLVNVLQVAINRFEGCAMKCHDDDVETQIADPSGGKIGDLYGKACKEGSGCYETLVHTAFCKAMRCEFGHDEAVNRATAAAFVYARSIYGYQSPEEQKISQDRNWEKGICSHGLGIMTCPCGCFEGD